MQLTSERDGNKLTVSIEGRVDTTTAPELEKYILENTDGVTELLLDLGEMSYTSSAGLRVLLKAHKLMSKQGELMVTKVQSDVMEIFDMTGFSDILTIE